MSNVINGNAAGFQDSIIGSQGADIINGLSGDDVLRGGKGNDTIIGGAGSDVLVGGLDADTFRWAAGHITEGATDYITDFSLNQGDNLSFMSSGGGQNVEILGVSLDYLGMTSAAAGGSASVDLQNNIGTGGDLTFTVRNSVTGNVQTIVLLDAWSGALSDQWNAYFTTLGTSLSVTA